MAIKRMRFLGLTLIGSLFLSSLAQAMPAFARQYNLTCAACHDAYPRLNEFGENFAASNYRLPHWRQTMADMGDDQLALPKTLPLGIRAQAFAQGRRGEDYDVATGPTGNASSFDMQAPYLVKVLSSAPLSEHITFYFYGIFAEKGGNGETVIEDAWFSHDDVFGSGIGAQVGQFQISDLMFPREVRLTFQDYYAYRAAGITYDRGVILDRGIGPVDIAIGATNGNGIDQNFSIDSPGYRRPDRMFDNDSSKHLFGRVGIPAGPIDLGVFGLSGKQKSATGYAGTSIGTRNTDKHIVGLDAAGSITPKIHWFAQGLWNRWSHFLDAAPTQKYEWYTGFAGVDYVYNSRWAFSALYNYADSNDFSGTGTIFEGIDMNSVSVGAAYYFMRNVKGVIEVNADLLGKRAGGPPYVGHQTKEHYILIGFDAAY